MFSNEYNKQKMTCELRFYHNGTGFIKTICKDNDKLNESLNLGDKLIRSGLEQGTNLNDQIIAFKFLIENTQKIKKYKISVEDQKIYCATILALYKLNKIDPDDPDCFANPFWISPKRKFKKSKK